MNTKLLASSLAILSNCLIWIGRPITHGLMLLVMGLIWLWSGVKVLPRTIGPSLMIWWGKKYKSWVRFFRRLLEHKSWRFLTGTGLISITILCLSASSEIYGQEATLDFSPEVSAELSQVVTTASIRAPLETMFLSQGYFPGHWGLDMRAPEGTPVHPIMKGEVKMVLNHTTGYGRHIIIDHGNNIESLYAHLSAIYVEEGQEVVIEEEVGAVGSTGNSTGPHLHLELIDQGKYVNPFTLIGGK